MLAEILVVSDVGAMDSQITNTRNLYSRALLLIKQ